MAGNLFKATQVSRKEAEDIYEREKQASVDADSNVIQRDSRRPRMASNDPFCCVMALICCSRLCPRSLARKIGVRDENWPAVKSSRRVKVKMYVAGTSLASESSNPLYPEELSECG